MSGLYGLLYHFPERGLKQVQAISPDQDLHCLLYHFPERGLKLIIRIKPYVGDYDELSPLPLPREGIETLFCPPFHRQYKVSFTTSPRGD